MPSKYEAILPSLKPLPPADPSYQDRVEAVKRDVTITDAAALVRDYVRLRAEKDRAEAEVSRINLHLEAYTQLLVASQESQAEGWGSYGVAENALRLANGDTVRVQHEPYAQAKDREAFRLWCIAHGYERDMHVHPKKAQSIAKERLMDGEALPDGVDVFVKDTVVYVPAKKGE